MITSIYIKGFETPYWQSEACYVSSRLIQPISSELNWWFPNPCQPISLTDSWLTWPELSLDCDSHVTWLERSTDLQRACACFLTKLTEDSTIQEVLFAIMISDPRRSPVACSVLLLAKEAESNKASHSFLTTWNNVNCIKSKRKVTKNTA